MLIGLAMGTTVSIARAVGGRNHKQVSENVGNTVMLFFGLSIVLTVVLLLLVRPIVGVMSTPAEAVDGTVAYLTICFLGIPFITAYNIISSIFRGMGDSKSPMYFIAIAGVANIALDYLFIGALDFGPAGAALRHNPCANHQCSGFSVYDSEAEKHFSFQGGLPSAPPCCGADFAGWCTCCPAGRANSDCVYRGLRLLQIRRWAERCCGSRGL